MEPNQLRITVLQARGLPARTKDGVVDAIARLFLSDQSVELLEEQGIVAEHLDRQLTTEVQKVRRGSRCTRA